MNCRKFISDALLLALLMFLGASITRAQDEPAPPDAPPKPAARSTPIPIVDTGNAQDDTPDPNQLLPDTTPLTGIQNPTVGTPGIRHSYFIPGFQFASVAQSNGTVQSATPGWVDNNYLIANFSALKAWSRSQFAVNYSGGGVLSTDSAQGNGYYQQFALSQSFQWDRVVLQLLDQFSYLPQSQFGFGGGTDLGAAGVGGAFGPMIPALGSNFVPNQSIYIAQGPRYSNASAAQLTYVLSPRGSITASGSYGILSFVDHGSVDNQDTTASLGYNYQLSRASTIGLLYRFSGFHFPGEPQAFGSQVVAVAYSRKLTGHMSLQLNGGPQITQFRVAVAGQTTSYGANITANFNYLFHNGGITTAYLHGLSGGSGVYTGSTVDQINFGATHKLGRVWTGQFNLGYAHNKSIASSGATSLPNFNSIFVGGGVNRPIGPNTNFAIAYTANITDSNQSACGSVACSVNQTSHYITVTLQWHARPFALD